MKINLPQRPNPNDLANPSFLAQHTSTVVQALSRNISFADNMQGAVMTVALAHGVPTLVANPLPQSATPLGVLDCQADTQLKPSVTVSKTAIVNGVLTTAPSGKLFLTAIYPVPPNLLRVSLANNTQSFATAVQSTVQFESTPDTKIGNSLSWDGSTTITTLNSGIFEFSYALRWVTNATGGRLASIEQGGAEPQLGYSAFATNAANSSGHSGFTGPMQVAAGIAHVVVAAQSSGGALTLNAFLPSTFFVGRQVDWLPTTTANVTLFLVGA